MTDDDIFYNIRTLMTEVAEFFHYNFLQIMASMIGE